MAMAIGPADGGEEDELLSAINTTPLVDVMLVLLIIFLITIPVVTRTVPVTLPKETNQTTQTKPENINISVSREGEIFWNDQQIPGFRDLVDKMKVAAVVVPQPEVHIRGDENARYEFVGKVVSAAQRAGISKVGFITEPPARGG
jgi:biopolymer transport protein ExbD